jgi:hypothetical protein
MGFYAKGFDGRIDDPNAGWKGLGLWTTSGDRAPWASRKAARKEAAVSFGEDHGRRLIGRQPLEVLDELRVAAQDDKSRCPSS